MQRHRPKIGPPAASSGAPDWLLDHGDLNMHAMGPPEWLVNEWTAAGLDLPDREAIRRYRIERVRSALRAEGIDAAVLYDPVNIRYATDTTNMSLWTAHNQVRFAFVAAGGPVVMFEFSKGEFLDSHSSVVDEIRPTISYAFMYVGTKSVSTAERWAGEIGDLLAAHSRNATPRLAVDTVELEGVRALDRLRVGGKPIKVVSAWPAMERARMIKCDDEIRAMRCAIHACETTIGEMHDIVRPGVTELDVWAALHHGNARRYGEWLETRLLASGVRSNPWYQEASGKVVEEGELLGFDTDMIGAYGACVDMSRTWYCGDGEPSATQRRTYELASEQVEHNIGLFQPGASWRDIVEAARYPDPDRYNRYTVIAHGVGLCDEYPSMPYREDWDEMGNDDEMRPGMVMCVEALVGDKRLVGVPGGEAVKLEEQVLITEHGPEVLTTYPLGLT